jgi:hypothetical protein
MALVPLEVLLDRLYDACPVCAGSAKPAGFAQNIQIGPGTTDDCMGPAMGVCVRSIRRSRRTGRCPRRRLSAGNPAPQGTRSH